MIEISNLKKSFGPKDVLKGINLKVLDGSIHCIIGKSGCGKSVLLKHIVGLLAPDSGTVKVDGNEISKMSYKDLFKLRQTIGYVFQGAALFDSYTVYENVIIGMYEHGQKKREVLEQEAKRVLSSVGLLPELTEIESTHFQKEWEIISNKKPSDLSGGMRKRVGVARALVGSPKYILYDEPTTGLDPITSEQIDNLISNLAERFGVTSVVITHDMFSVFKEATHVSMLEAGFVHFDGNVEQLHSNPDTVVKEFLERYK